MAISREIEIKLRTTPEAIDLLLEAPLLAASIPGSINAQTLDATYYDTADLQLHKRGISLRVRKEGDRYVQTIKAPQMGSAAFDRQEFETVVADSNPRPDWVTDKTARAVVGHLSTEELVPVCRTLIERETRVIGYPYNGEVAIVEIAFDRGTLEAGEISEPAAEIELELLKGNTQALFALALELHEIAPLQIESRSKAERAYALFTGAPPTWHKAEKHRFEPDTTVDEGISAIFRGCFDHWLVNVPATLDGSDPEGLHQMRVAIRRMRSALDLFSGVLPTLQSGWLERECQWLGSALGGARNWDVFLDDVLAPLETSRPEDEALPALRQQCEIARGRHHEIAREAIQSPRYTTLVLNLSHWLDEAAWRKTNSSLRHELLAAPLKAYTDTVLERLYRRMTKRGKGLAKAAPEKRHKLRISIKRMRYASDFFASLYKPKPSRAMLSDLSKLQDTLGDLNDLAVTERQLETVVYQAFADPSHDQVIKGVGLVIGWGTARARRDESKLLGQWRHLRDLKPFWKRPK